MGTYAALVDTAKCMGCKACQVACKQWNGNPAERTAQVGSHQNPEDLSPLTFTLVRFQEQIVRGYAVWTFFKDQCRHCLEPPCKEAADLYLKDAVIQDPNGAVVFTEKTRDCDFKEIYDACPYGIPRLDPVTGIIYKCAFCHERVAAGMLPACIKACPSGALQFGVRVEILKKADQLLAHAQTTHSAASIPDSGEVSWIYVLHQPEVQFQMTRRERKPSTMYALRSLFKPLGVFAAGAALVGQVAKGGE